MPILSYSKKIPLLGIITLFILSLFVSAPSYAEKPANTEAFIASIELLKSKSFKDKSKALDQLATTKDSRTLNIIEAMLKARLFYTKADKTVVITVKGSEGYAITSVLKGDVLGTVEKSKLKKITVNNKLRKKIRALMASLKLNNPDADVRLEAVKQMINNTDEASLTALKTQLKQEKDEAVKEKITTILNLDKLSSDDEAVKLEAISALADNLEPEVRSKMEALTASENKAVASASKKALQSIDESISFYENVKTLFFGLSLGSILVLASIGLAITFGVMGVINMAHGELIMIGAYTTYVIQQLMPNHIGLSLAVAVPAAFIISGFVGILIERLVIRHLYDRPLETLLATFGISLILQQAVRVIFSPLNRSVETPQWMSGSLEINSVLSLTYNRLYIILFCLIVFALLYVAMKKTSLGLSVRAVSQNRPMARAMGIRADRIDALTFGLGSGIAGVAGVALSQLTNVGPNLGQAYIIDSFMVVVFGGVGNLWGALISGFTLGIANKFLEPWAGAVLAKVMILVFIILFIQKRPRGLFPQKGRGAGA
ncbi:MAG TPA: urea ABC transporter permease subunit UrtB [Leucothrix mucor]|nr:urea ABC transporter permease subunit UrtB [Leucothrix mucor]